LRFLVVKLLAPGAREDVALAWRHVLEAYTSHVLTVNLSRRIGFTNSQFEVIAERTVHEHERRPATNLVE
jgi:hypothetical protein